MKLKDKTTTYTIEVTKQELYLIEHIARHYTSDALINMDSKEDVFELIDDLAYLEAAYESSKQ